jgi:hypothetical protein
VIRRVVRRPIVPLIVALTCAMPTAAFAVNASTWSVALHSGSIGAGQGDTLNAATSTAANPTTGSSTSLTVTWSGPSSGATPSSYNVQESTFNTGTSTCGTFSTVGTNVTSPYAAGSLTSSTEYCFKVVDLLGANWTSTTSVFMGTTSAPTNSVHISALSASPNQNNTNNYHSSVTVTVRDQSGTVISGVSVTGAWTGVSGATFPSSTPSGSCAANTNSSGQCTVSSVNNEFTDGSSYVWTISSLSLSGYTYSNGSNVDNKITVFCPSSGSCTATPST